MNAPVAAPRTGNAVLPAEGLAQLLGLLVDDGYEVLGPTVGIGHRARPDR
jgi:hypothetical protein